MSKPLFTQSMLFGQMFGSIKESALQLDKDLSKNTESETQ